jgi:hypothetical protein
MLNCFFSLSSYLTSSLFKAKVKVLSYPRSPISETALLSEGEYGALAD